MKRFLLTTLALFGICLTTIAQEAPNPQHEKPQRQNPQNREEMRKKMQERMEKRITEMAEKIRARYDKNQDGKLDEQELAAMKKEFELAREVFPLAQSYNIIEKLDKDNDLILSKEELADAAKVLRENRGPGRGGRMQEDGRREGGKPEKRGGPRPPQE